MPPGRSERGRRLPSVIACLAACVLAAFSGLGGCRSHASAPPTSGGAGAEPGVSITPMSFPQPVLTAWCSVVFLGTDGVVYEWAPAFAHADDLAKKEAILAGKAVPLYRPDPGWAMVAFVPALSRQYVAVLESPAPGQGPARRVTILETGPARARHLVPPEGFLSEVISVQWSGAELLLVNGPHPLVFSVTEGSISPFWDLGTLAPPGSEFEVLRPLGDLGFSRVAFTRSGDPATRDANLWVISRDALAPEPVRVTTGDLGVYPVAWLGVNNDCSSFDGPGEYLLVEVKAGPAGSEGAKDLAVVNVRTKEVQAWHQPGETSYEFIFLYRAGGRALIASANAATGQDRRLLWHWLKNGQETEVTELRGLVAEGAAEASSVLDSAVVLVEREASPGGPVRHEVWRVSGNGMAFKIGDITPGLDAHILGGTSHQAVLMTVAGTAGNPAGGSAAVFLLADPANYRLLTVELQAAAGGE